MDECYVESITEALVERWKRDFKFIEEVYGRQIALNRCTVEQRAKWPTGQPTRELRREFEVGRASLILIAFPSKNMNTIRIQLQKKPVGATLLMSPKLYVNERHHRRDPCMSVVIELTLNQIKSECFDLNNLTFTHQLTTKILHPNQLNHEYRNQ